MIKMGLILLAIILAGLAALGIGHPRLALGWASLACFEASTLVN